MILTINLRDSKARDWEVFWHADVDKPEIPLARFGFRLFVRDLTTDATRIATACKERMKWVRATLYAEEMATMTKHYATVKDCRSHRGITSGIKAMNKTIAIAQELTTRLGL